MRIAYLTPVFPPYYSGISTTAYDYADKMSYLGHDVTVITPVTDTKLGSQKFNIVYLKPWVRIGHGYLIPQIIPILKRGDFDILHLHFPFFGAMEILALLCFLSTFKKPLVIHYHMDFTPRNYLFRLMSFWGWAAGKYLFRKASAVTVSTFDFLINSNFKSQYLSDRNKFYEINFGVDLELFQPDERITKTPQNKFIFVGALDKAHYFKGVENLLKAFATITNPNIFLQIVGDGDMKNEYQKMANDLKMTNVTFSGYLDRTQLIQSYKEAVALILPSINQGETFGMVLIEAMACGTPVIASNLPGVRQVLNDRENGLLVEPANINDLIDKINILANNRELSLKMAYNARKRAEDKFNLKKNIIKIEKIYHTIK